MAFVACDFIYDGMESERFCLKIFDLDGNGVINSPASANVSIVSDEVRRRSVPYDYGSQLTPVLTFPLTFGSFEPLDKWDQRIISQWLFGRREHKWLDIIQCDLMTIRFNCRLLNPEVVHIGNIPYAFRCDVVCNAPWAWGFEESFSYNLSGSEIIEFNNTSEHDGYYFPQLKITPANITNNFSIINKDDSDREFKLFDINTDGSEEFFFDNDKQIFPLTSQGLDRVNNFNYKWLRFIPGYNTLEIQGAGKMEIICTFPRKVGG